MPSRSIRRRQRADPRDLPPKVRDLLRTALSHAEYTYVRGRWRLEFDPTYITNQIDADGLMDGATWDQWIRTFRLRLDADLRRCPTCEVFFRADHGLKEFCSTACRPKGKGRTTAEERAYKKGNRKIHNRHRLPLETLARI